MSYRDGKIYVYLIFNREVKLKDTRAIMGVDINFNNITYTIIDLNSNLISMSVVPFRGLSRALRLKKLAEKLQRKYPKSWRFLKWVRRARNILTDSSHYIAKRIVKIAKEYNTVIVSKTLRSSRRERTALSSLGNHTYGVTRGYSLTLSIRH